MAKRAGRRAPGAPGRRPAPGEPRPGAGGTPPAGAAAGAPGRVGTRYLSPSLFLGWLAGSTAAYDDRAFTSQPGTADAYLWAHPANRRHRYSVFWALYEATIFERLHRWAAAIRHRHALPPLVESLYSPANRVGEFWGDHVWGGALDRAAGDGTAAPSALPIVTAVADLPPALARLWRDSHWQARKDTAPLYGAVLGDVFLAVRDDPRSRVVTLEVHHPGYYRDVDEDSRGNVRGYVYEEVVRDPRWADVQETAPPVTRMVVCDRAGLGVRYRTFLEGQPYDWLTYEPGETPVGPEWVEDYGFVPLVKIQHRDRNLGWGYSELQATRGRMVTLDGVVSKLCEQLYKAVEAPRLYKGLKGPEDLEIDAWSDEDGADRDGGRDESRFPALYTTNPQASTELLTGGLSLADGLALADALLTRVVESHPEVLADLGDTGTNPSGAAIQKAREKVERRVVARRAGYDEALVRAQAMAVSIGGLRGYPGYEAFPAGSYEAGRLTHAVGDRPVFAADEADRLADAARRAGVFKTLRDGGVPLAEALREAGYAEDRVVAVAVAAADEAAVLERTRAAAAVAAAPAPVPAGSVD